MVNLLDNRLRRWQKPTFFMSGDEVRPRVVANKGKGIFGKNSTIGQDCYSKVEFKPVKVAWLIDLCSFTSPWPESCVMTGCIIISFKFYKTALNINRLRKVRRVNLLWYNSSKIGYDRIWQLCLSLRGYFTMLQVSQIINEDLLMVFFFFNKSSPLELISTNTRFSAPTFLYWSFSFGR